MLRLIPAPVQRALMPLAHRVRQIIWQITKPELTGVAVIALDLSNQLLLVRHSYGPEGWAVPSGGVKSGEDVLATARRELLEETGCEAGNLTELGVQVENLSGATNSVHVFSGRVSGQPRPDGRETIEARFFPTHSLPEPLLPATRRRLALWREAQK
ncbi:NUDIX domain-containing protein [Erythrobacter sp. HKB08]|uniref:NUDIX domain-containing protein n=1 Tax=Erythrobacter sp. HKB08 TaxID=2502843 RepID=UPI0010086B3A|nr:NUDIX domain-containing protein [Erythrobacter sp. HKB08]